MRPARAICCPASPAALAPADRGRPLWTHGGGGGEGGEGGEGGGYDDWNYEWVGTLGCLDRDMNPARQKLKLFRAALSCLPAPCSSSPCSWRSGWRTTCCGDARQASRPRPRFWEADEDRTAARWAWSRAWPVDGAPLGWSSCSALRCSRRCVGLGSARVHPCFTGRRAIGSTAWRRNLLRS